MDKLKLAISSVMGYIVLAFGVVVGVLVWLLNIKNKELEANKESIALVQTQKDADMMEVTIKAKLADVNTNEADKKALQQSLDILEQKRTTLTDPRTTDEAKSDYWNDKK